MKLSQSFPAISSLIVLLGASANGQSIVLDGLTNSPLGTASLGQGAAGEMVVSNIGSSGLDGVSIDLANSQGTKFKPTMALGIQGRCSLRADVMRNGAPASVPVAIQISADGTGTGSFFTPDYSGLGFQDYTLRLFNNGQLVYDQGGLNGPTKMQSGGGWADVPVEVYMFTMPAGTWGGSVLTCFPYEGGGIVTPPGGNPLSADFMEFISPPAQVVGIESVSVLAADINQFSIESEALRTFDHWAQGLDDARLTVLPSGVMMVDNLGSSGCDGVSIDPGGGSNELYGELQELAAPNHFNGLLKFESSTASGEVDRLTIDEAFGTWNYIPDFSQLGSPTYSLEMYNDGQLVFQQAGRMGPAVAATAFSSFHKKTSQGSMGTTTEWSIRSSSSTAHTVSGGPTLQADHFIVRSEPFQVADASLTRVMLRAGNLNTPMFLNTLGNGPACLGTSYCISAPNSAGAGALICSAGSPSVAANNLLLTATGLPANKFGLFFYGPNQIQTPFGNGFRCVGGQLNRLPAQLSSAAGSVVHALDNTAPPTAAGQIFPGQVWNFQFWYRDPAGAGAGFNLSDGHSLLFTP